jgi:hypothetical protein
MNPCHCLTVLAREVIIRIVVTESSMKRVENIIVSCNLLCELLHGILDDTIPAETGSTYACWVDQKCKGSSCARFPELPLVAA